MRNLLDIVCNLFRIMKAVQVQFAPWDKRYNFAPADLIINIGDQVIVKTELGRELGKVVGFQDLPDTDKNVNPVREPRSLSGNDHRFKSVAFSNWVKEPASEPGAEPGNEIKKIIRKAAPADFEKLPDARQKKRDFEYCKKIIDKLQLPMKLVDVYYSYDGLRVTFPFIADSRVDFRELVKDLTKRFGRSIRLQQIGIRDEARFCGDFGHCGRPLCCGQFLGELNSITSEMAELQQCVHRGSERISGVCGRLMCCLAYEADGYKKLAEKLPPIDSQVKVEGRKGRVLALYILKQTVKVLLDEGNGEAGGVVEVEANKIRK